MATITTATSIAATSSTSWLTWFWSLLWQKSTWLRTIQLLNIMLSAHNHKGELALKARYNEVGQKINYVWPPPASKSSTSIDRRDDIALGVQSLVAFLQGVVAYHYRRERDNLNDMDYFDVTNKDVADFSLENDGEEEEEEWSIGSFFRDMFNSKTKVYVSVVEKSVKGVLELIKALGELGSLADRRRSFRRQFSIAKRRNSESDGGPG